MTIGIAIDEPVRMISTHTSLAGRDKKVIEELKNKAISTHTSLAGRDIENLITLDLDENFYSHVPRGT